MAQFYRVGQDPTVFTQTGTAFRTPEEFYAAGGAQDFSNVQSVTSASLLPFSSAKTLTGENVQIPGTQQILPESQAPGGALPGVAVDQTIPSDILREALREPTKAESPAELMSRLRVERGLAPLETAQQQLTKEILERQRATEEGLIREEGRLAPLAIIGGRQQILKEQMNKIIQPLVDTFKLNAQQIENVQKSIEQQVGLAGEEREFQSKERERRFNRFMEVYKVGRDEAERQRSKALGTQVDEEGNVSAIFQRPDGTFGFQVIGKVAKSKMDQKIAEEVDDAGNLTLVFQKPDGSTYSQTIKGVGKTAKEPKASIFEKKQQEFDKVQDNLLRSRGTDGYVDPNVYLSLRREARVSPDEFDKRFGDLLSPNERENLAIAGRLVKAERSKREEELLGRYQTGGPDALSPEEFSELYVLLSR